MQIKRKHFSIVIIFVFIILAFVFYSKGLGGVYSIKGNDGNYSAQMFLQKWICQGIWNRWNAQTGLGLSVHTPVSIFVFAEKFFPANIALSVSYMLALILTFLFSFLFLRRLRLNEWSAAFGALGFAFAPQFLSLIYSGHFTVVELPAMIAVLFYFITIVFSDSEKPWQSFLALIPAGVAWGVMMSQDPQRGLYISALVGAYILLRIILLYKEKRNEKNEGNDKIILSSAIKTIIILLFLFGTFFPSMKGWLSFDQVGKKDKISQAFKAPEKTPAQKWAFSTSWSYHPEDMLFGQLAWGYEGLETGNPTYPYWGHLELSLSTEYIGLILLFFMIIGTTFYMKKKKGKYFNYWKIENPIVRLFFWAGVVGFLLSMGKYWPGMPLFWLFYHIPFMDRFRIPVKFLAITGVSWTIVAAFGFQAMQQLLLEKHERDAFVHKVLKGLFVLVSITILWFLVVLLQQNDIVRGLVHRLGNTVMGQKAVTRMILSLGRMLLFSVLLLIFILIIRYKSKIKEVKIIAPVFAILLMLFDLWSVDAFYLQKSYFKPAEFYQKGQLITELQKRVGLSRLTMSLKYPASKGSVGMFVCDSSYGIYKAYLFPYYNIDMMEISGSSRPDMLLRHYYFSLLAGSVSKGTGLTMENIVPLSLLMNKHFMQLMATRYLLTDGYLYVGGQRRILGYTLLSNKNYNYIGGFRDKNGTGHYLFELKNVLPRVAFYPDFVSLNNPEMILKTISETNFDLQHLVVVQGINPDKYISGRAYQKVEVLNRKPWSLKIKVKADEEGIILRNERYNSDWHVYVDGKISKLLRANYIMQAVMVPKGEHLVEFRFEPAQAAAKLSVYMVVMALLSILILIVMSIFDRRNKTPVS